MLISNGNIEVLMNEISSEVKVNRSMDAVEAVRGLFLRYFLTVALLKCVRHGAHTVSSDGGGVHWNWNQCAVIHPLCSLSAAGDRQILPEWMVSTRDAFDNALLSELPGWIMSRQLFHFNFSSCPRFVNGYSILELIKLIPPEQNKKTHDRVHNTDALTFEILTNVCGNTVLRWMSHFSSTWSSAGYTISSIDLKGLHRYTDGCLLHATLCVPGLKQQEQHCAHSTSLFELN